MKKTLAILACTVLAASLAGAEEVVSSNTVGYTKVAFASGYNMLGTQFQQVGENVKDINELISKENNLPGLDDSGNFQTLMLAWNGIGYDYYGWLDADDGTANEVPEWNSSFILFDMSDIAVVDIDLAKAFWIQTTDSGTITFSGEVSESNSIERPIASGFNMYSSPFPQEQDIQKIQMSSDIPGLDDSGNFQTLLLAWNGIGYDYYGWLDADDGTANEVPEWNSSWILFDMSDIANVNIGIGQAFWIQTTGAGKVTFSK